MLVCAFLGRDSQPCPAEITLAGLGELESDIIVLQQAEIAAVLLLGAAALSMPVGSSSVGEQHPIRCGLTKLPARPNLGAKGHVCRQALRAQQHLCPGRVRGEEAAVPPEKLADAGGRKVLRVDALRDIE